MKLARLFVLTILLLPAQLMAADYIIDKKGMHASIRFKVSHLGYSWLWGRFNDFDGTFSYDSNNPDKSKINVVINTRSVDSNHAERDKHLRNEDFLEVDKYPEAKFVSTSYKETSKGKGVLKGDFTLRGITRPIEIDVTFTGEGKDPWGGYRAGFEGSTTIAMADYKIKKNLGPSSQDVHLYFVIEGVRQ